MQVWNVLHAVRWKYRTQKVAKNRHLCTIAQLCRAITSQLRHVSTIGKKLVKQANLVQDLWWLYWTVKSSKMQVLYSTNHFVYHAAIMTQFVMVALWNRADHYIFALFHNVLMHHIIQINNNFAACVQSVRHQHAYMSNHILVQTWLRTQYW